MKASRLAELLVGPQREVMTISYAGVLEANHMSAVIVGRRRTFQGRILRDEAGGGPLYLGVEFLPKRQGGLDVGPRQT